MLINFERQVPHIKKKLWAIYLKNQLQNLVNQYFKSQGSLFPQLESYEDQVQSETLKSFCEISYTLILT